MFPAKTMYPARTPKRFPIWKTTAIASTAVLVLLTIGNIWTFRTILLSQDFVRLILNNQMLDASAMVARPSELAVSEEQIAIKARDGSSWIVPINKPRFEVLDESSRPSRDGVWDYILGRQHFQLCAMWKDVPTGNDVVLPIYCSVNGSKIEIDHVGLK